MVAQDNKPEPGFWKRLALRCGCIPVYIPAVIDSFDPLMEEKLGSVARGGSGRGTTSRSASSKHSYQPRSFRGSPSKPRNLDGPTASFHSSASGDLRSRSGDLRSRSSFSPRHWQLHSARPHLAIHPVTNDGEPCSPGGRISPNSAALQWANKPLAQQGRTAGLVVTTSKSLPQPASRHINPVYESDSSGCACGPSLPAGAASAGPTSKSGAQLLASCEAYGGRGEGERRPGAKERQQHQEDEDGSREGPERSASDEPPSDGDSGEARPRVSYSQPKDAAAGLDEEVPQVGANRPGTAATAAGNTSRQHLHHHHHRNHNRRRQPHYQQQHPHPQAVMPPRLWCGSGGAGSQLSEAGAPHSSEVVVLQPHPRTHSYYVSNTDQGEAAAAAGAVLDQGSMQVAAAVAGSTSHGGSRSEHESAGESRCPSGAPGGQPLTRRMSAGALYSDSSFGGGSGPWPSSGGKLRESMNAALARIRLNNNLPRGQRLPAHMGLQQVGPPGDSGNVPWQHLEGSPAPASPSNSPRPYAQQQQQPQYQYQYQHPQHPLPPQQQHLPSQAPPQPMAASCELSQRELLLQFGRPADARADGEAEGEHGGPGGEEAEEAASALCSAAVASAASNTTAAASVLGARLVGSHREQQSGPLTFLAGPAASFSHATTVGGAAAAGRSMHELEAMSRYSSAAMAAAGPGRHEVASRHVLLPVSRAGSVTSANMAVHVSVPGGVTGGININVNLPFMSTMMLASRKLAGPAHRGAGSAGGGGVGRTSFDRAPTAAGGLVGRTGSVTSRMGLGMAMGVGCPR